MTSSRGRSLVAVVGRALRLVAEAGRGGLTIALLLGVVSGLVAGAQVLVARHMLNVLLHQNARAASFRPVIAPLVLLLGAGLVGGLAKVAQTQQTRILGERARRHAVDRILATTAAVDLETFDEPVFFDRVQRVMTNAVNQPATITQNVITLATTIVGAAAIAVTVIAIHPALLPLLVLAALPAVLLARAAGRMEYRFTVGQTLRLRQRDYFERVLTTRDFAKEVRAFELGPAVRVRWDKRALDYIDAFRTHLIRIASVNTLTTALGLAGMSGALGILLWLVDSRRITLGAAGAAVVAIQLLSSRINGLIGSISGLFESGLFLEEMETFVAPPNTTAAPAFPAFEHLAVRDVTYRYPGADVDALRGVTLDIGQGEVVALVGENGSGKTTLAKVLAGLLPPTAGTVAWDDTSLQWSDAAAVRRSVAVLFQDFARYELTATENIGFGDVSRLDDTERINDAARRAGAHDFLASLPDGYGTPLSRVYAGGRDLSIGQWQRVALARAYLRDSPFLILDEPSASLDPRAERALFDQIRDAMRGRSVLLITHRLASVRDADRIYVLAAGQVTEQGTHEALVRQGGLYAELWRMQSEGYAPPSVSPSDGPRSAPSADGPPSASPADS